MASVPVSELPHFGTDAAHSGDTIVFKISRHLESSVCKDGANEVTDHHWDHYLEGNSVFK